MRFAHSADFHQRFVLVICFEQLFVGNRHLVEQFILEQLELVVERFIVEQFFEQFVVKFRVVIQQLVEWLVLVLVVQLGIVVQPIERLVGVGLRRGFGERLARSLGLVS